MWPQGEHRVGGKGSGPPPKLTKLTTKSGKLKLPAGYPRILLETFNTLVEELSQHPLAPVDAYTIADCAAYLWQKREALAQLAKEGITTTDAAHGGEVRKHPALTIYRQADMQFQRLAIQLGMTPASRARLMPPEPEIDDPYDDYRNANSQKK